MKRLLSILGVGVMLAATAGFIFADDVVVEPGAPAKRIVQPVAVVPGAPVQSTSTAATTKTSRAALFDGMAKFPFDDVGNLMQHEVADILRMIPLSALKEVADIVGNIGQLVKTLPTIMVDVALGSVDYKGFPTVISCAKMREDLRMQSVECKAMKLDAKRAQVFAEALRRMRTMLQPLMDMFAGYKDKNGQQQPPLINTLMRTVKQEGQIVAFQKIAEALKATDGVINELQKVLSTVK